MIEILTSAIVSGLMLGGLYGGISVGLSLIFGVIRVVNFAHGAFLMLSMYTSFWLWYFFKMNPYLSIFVVMPVFFISGFAVQSFLIKPMIKRESAFVVEPLGVLLLMAGLDLVLSNLALLCYGSNFRSISNLSSISINIGFINMNNHRLILLFLAFLATGGIYWILNHTEVGTAIKAVGQNREAAALCGVNVYWIYSFTFGLGTAATAMIGAAMTTLYSIHPSMGMNLGIKAFIVVVLGGLGSVPGALVAGLIIGVVESVTSQFVQATSSVIASFLLFVIVMIIRPKGLMGTLEA